MFVTNKLRVSFYINLQLKLIVHNYNVCLNVHLIILEYIVPIALSQKDAPNVSPGAYLHMTDYIARI